MKMIGLLFINLYLVNLIYAQVGINTSDPIGIFHIDGKGDNGGTSSNYQDDLIVDSIGNIGLGRKSTGAKIDILSGTKTAPHSGFRLVDGNESEGRVLTSDANGFATWKEYSLQVRGVLGQFSDMPLAICGDPTFSDTVGGYPIEKRVGDAFVKTGGQITLGHGKWKVRVTCRIDILGNADTSMAWVRFILADDKSISNTPNSAQRSDDLVYASSMVNDLVWLDNDIAGALSGYFLLENKGDAPKTYYLVCGWIDRTIAPIRTKAVFLLGGNTDENMLYATKIN